MRSYQMMAAVGIMLVLATAASAGYAHFWDRATYEASVPGAQTTTDFSVETIDPGSMIYWDSSYTNNGVEFSYPTKNIVMADTGYGGYGQRSIIWNDADAMLVYLPAGVTSIGVDMYVDPGYAAATLCTAWLSDGTSSSVLAPAKGKATSSFWGCQATDGVTITHFTSYATSFSQEGGPHATPPTWDWASPGIGAFSYSVVPEPSSIVLLGFGLMSLLVYAWRQRK
jgi:hypothetical protein